MKYKKYKEKDSVSLSFETSLTLHICENNVWCNENENWVLLTG